MLTRVALLDYLADYLAIDTFKDYAPNGLQVEGMMDIARIRTAVTASEAVIEAAAADKASALLVHHGYFWRGENPVICGMKRRRVNALLMSDMNLLAYHLPIDCHPALGNNACMAKRLGLTDVKAYAAGGTNNLLWTGNLPNPITIDALKQQLAVIYQREPQSISGTKKTIQRIAFCTGAAQDFIEDAHALGVDAYLSGEISERTYYQAKELGIAYFACGHHATEKDGIKALGEHLATQFGIEHAFIDTDNPI